MEVYTLDSNRRRMEVIDRFNSLIWTERFQASGDFKLTLPATRQSRGLLKPGTQLVMNESYRVMTVETLEEKAGLLTVSGPSIESILADRIAAASLTSDPTWHIEDVPADIVRTLFHDICVLGTLNELDIVQGVSETSIMPADTITEPVDPLVLDIPPTQLYDLIKNLSEIWGLGFRLIRDINTGVLHWDVYTGSDRTTSQEDLTPVVFSEGLDNLHDISELHSIETSKNVAYVFSPDGFLEVVADGVAPDLEGFERRVLMVQADDLTDASVDDLGLALLQRGREELAKNRALQAFDGEIDQSSQYRYQVDYWLGDVVELRDNSGDVNQMRVAEQTFVSDAEGDRSYPTLTLNRFINTGTWLSWLANQVWHDLEDDPITWSEAP